MSNTAIFGKEVTIRVAIGGQLQEGTFLRIKSFDHTPRTELIEEDYLGEDRSELDLRHDGHDLKFECDEDDDSAINFLTALVALEGAHQRPQQITITAYTVYRDGVTQPLVESFPEVMLKLTSRTVGGRKERVPNSFEGKCKRYNVIRQ